MSAPSRPPIYLKSCELQGHIPKTAKLRKKMFFWVERLTCFCHTLDSEGSRMNFLSDDNDDYNNDESAENISAHFNSLSG